MDRSEGEGNELMVNVTLICVGKMKEKPYRQMADEYLKRLSRYGKVEEIELPDLPEPANSSAAIEMQIKEKEGGVKRKSFSCEGCPSAAHCKKASCAEMSDMHAQVPCENAVKEENENDA